MRNGPLEGQNALSLTIEPMAKNKTFLIVFFYVFFKFLLSFGLNSPILIRFSVKAAEIIKD